MATKYRVIIEETKSRQRLVIFPRSRKTSLFASFEAAERALDRQSRRLPDGWRGLIYEAGAPVGAPAILTMAL